MDVARGLGKGNIPQFRSGGSQVPSLSIADGTVQLQKSHLTLVETQAARDMGTVYIKLVV